MLISGSLRRGSTNTALIHTAQALAPDTVSAVIFEGMEALPHFNPDDDPADGSKDLHPAVVELREQIAMADAVLLSTPEYAGALPGSFKNVLDWSVGSEDFPGMPVAWINVSTSTGAPDAHDSLRKVLGFIKAEVMEDACARIPVPRSAVGADGLIEDEAIRLQTAEVVEKIVRHLR